MTTVSLESLTASGGFVGGPFGSNLVSSDYESSGIPVIRGSNMLPDGTIGGKCVYVSEAKFQRDLSRNTARADDLVFTQRGTLGQVARVRSEDPQTYVISQSQMRMTVDESKADPRYVLAACRLPSFLNQIDALAIRTGVPHINLSILKELTIPYLPLEVQRAIAEVLGALDDKIAANRRLVASADELISAIVVPTLVEECRLWDAVDFTFGEAFKGSYFTPSGSGRPLIRIRDLNSQQCQVWTTETRPREHVVENGEVLVGMDAEFHAIRWSGPSGVLNQRVLLACSSVYGDPVVREILKDPLRRIERSKSGTTVIHLNKQDLQSEVANVPRAEDISRIREGVDPLWERCVAAEQESTRLAATRDELLPLLMRGKIAVKDAERLVEQEV